MDEPVRHPGNAERSGQEFLGTRKAGGQMRVGALQMLQQRWPFAACPAQQGGFNQHAEIGFLPLDQLQTGIAAGKQQQFHMARERPMLGGSEPEIDFEADKRTRAATPRGAARLVLARGEQQGLWTQDAKILHLDGNLRCYGNMPDAMAAPHGDTRLTGMVEQCLIQHFARQADPFEGQLRRDHIIAAHETQIRNPVAAKLLRIEAELVEIGLRLRTQKFAADFIYRIGGTLDQRDFPPSLGKARRGGSTRQPATGDKDRAHFNRLML